MNSLVKVPPYSKLKFQGKIFFTQNWCNITLISRVNCICLFQCVFYFSFSVKMMKQTVTWLALYVYINEKNICIIVTSFKTNIVKSRPWFKNLIFISLWNYCFCLTEKRCCISFIYVIIVYIFADKTNKIVWWEEFHFLKFIFFQV